MHNPLWTDKLTAICTAVIAALTGFIAITAWIQLPKVVKATGRSARSEAKRASEAKKQANETKRIADAAWKQAGAVKRQATILERQSNARIEALASRVYQDYLSVRVKYAKLVTPEPSKLKMGDQRRYWPLATRAYYTAATLFELTGGKNQKGRWKKSTLEIVRDFEPFAKRGIPCGRFDKDFVQLVQKEVAAAKCSVDRKP